MKNPYEILGADENATIKELRVRYEDLKAQYSEGRFKPGEEGATAAKKLTELERAWSDILSRQEVVEATELGDDYSFIDKLIKDQKYDEAQSALDGIMNRSAEWHYFQALIYYRREWLTECKKQLEAAIAMDPNNQKYRDVLNKLEQVMGNPNVNPQSVGRDNIGGAPNGAYEVHENGGGDTLSNCCLAYCIASSCCDCMRCCSM